MLPEGVALLSLLASITSLVQRAKLARDAERRRVASELESEIRDFVQAVLGWYNEIVKLVVKITQDLRSGSFDNQEVHEYQRELAVIRRKDEFYTPCRNFAKERVRYFIRSNVLNKRAKERLRRLPHEYERFERRVFNMKGKLWLKLGERLDASARRALAAELERDVTAFERAKDILVTRREWADT